MGFRIFIYFVKAFNCVNRDLQTFWTESLSKKISPLHAGYNLQRLLSTDCVKNYTVELGIAESHKRRRGSSKLTTSRDICIQYYRLGTVQYTIQIMTRVQWLLS